MNASIIPHILVIGAVAVDTKGQSFGDLVRRSDVPGHAHMNVGGVARNMAKNLALLSANVTIVSVIGDDQFGRMICADLSNAHVNIDHLRTIPNQHTASWVGILNAHGDLDLGVFDGEIFSRLTPQLINEHAVLFSQADLVAVDATIPHASIDAVISHAKANRVPVYLNPASAARAQTIADCVGNFTIITANALETQVLTEQTIHSIDDAKQAAQNLIERGVHRAIVTLGEDGIVYADAHETRHLPAHPTNLVDTTGAGDALAAMFLRCHLQQRPLSQTLELSLRSAAMTAACSGSVNEEIGQLWTNS